MRICRLQNPIRHYAWGSRTAIAELQSRPSPTAEPEAELWMGAHASAPSSVELEGGQVPLDRLIASRPQEVLGERTGGPPTALPFLFKVLAAAEPLSLQVHPDVEQAGAGFERENRAGLGLDDPRRSYRDPHPKPEVVCALSPFSVLYGFRPLEESLPLLQRAAPEHLAADLEAAANAPDAARALETLFSGLLARDAPACRPLVAEARRRAEGLGEPLAGWVRTLAEHYPEDAGALAPLFLNLVRLDPDQALFTDAGVLHSYLEGTAVELMGCSDNVLRGGLTGKHVDREGLLEIVRFEVTVVEILEGREMASGETVYDTPSPDFRLSRIQLERGRPFVASGHRSTEILLCVAGEGILTGGGEPPLDFRQGDSFLVPATATGYRLEGRGRLFRATGPVAAPR